MMMPSIFGESLFDDWMDFPFEREFFGRKNPLYGKHEKNMRRSFRQIGKRLSDYQRSKRPG